MFRKAIKHEAKLRMAIAGPSGSGKTYTALAVATNLVTSGRVALIDTEHGSASKYADLFDFDVLDLEPPFHPNRFVEAIQAAAEAGYEVLVIDSLSHAWNGAGGLLEIVDTIAKANKGGNTFSAWADATPIQNKMIDAMLAADLHLISTMRSKQEYAAEKDEKGRMQVRKLGLAPIQRDSVEYEFDVFLDMDMANNGIVQKTRCVALTGRVLARPGTELAATLADWLAGEPPPRITDSADYLLLREIGQELYGRDWDAKREELIAAVTKGRTRLASELMAGELDRLLTGIQKEKAKRGKEKENGQGSSKKAKAKAA